jgi:hypothetical protein
MMKEKQQAYTAQEEESSLLLAKHVSTDGSCNSSEGVDDCGIEGGGPEYAVGHITYHASVHTPTGGPFQEAALLGEVHSIVGKAGSGPKKVHIMEAKVFTTLNNSVSKEPRCWVLDTGALNHMTGSQQR